MASYGSAHSFGHSYNYGNRKRGAAAREYAVECLERRMLLSGGYTLNTLAVFDGGNGAGPEAGLTADAAGNLYGTTFSGGTDNDGTIFEVAAGNHALSTLATFNGSNGANPQDGVTLDANGNLYGTINKVDTGYVFELPAGTKTLNTLASLAIFASAATLSEGGVVFDAAGNLYGTTRLGGDADGGTLFKLAAGASAPTTLASFAGTNIGSNPMGNLISDPFGNWYGTTSSGGESGQGTVFEFAYGTLTTLASFNSYYTNTSDPVAGLIRDPAGNLYGTTSAGGANAAGAVGDGTVFEVAAGSNVVTNLAAFNGSDGASPQGALIMDAAGNLYGTTYSGGADNDGTVFEIAAGTHALTTLVNFDGANGANPICTLISDAAGDLYGTTSGGGANNDGTVFEIPGVMLEAGRATKLAFVPLPSVWTSNDLPTATVLAEDANGDLASSYNGTVNLGLASGRAGSSLFGLITVQAVNGVATFKSQSVEPFSNVTEVYTLSATCNDGLTSATSNPITIAYAPQLVFIQQPTTTPTGGVISPAVSVAVEDGNGNLVSSYDSQVTVESLGGFSGTLTVQAVNGVATFSDLSTDVAGTYNLGA